MPVLAVLAVSQPAGLLIALARASGGRRRPDRHRQARPGRHRRRGGDGGSRRLLHRDGDGHDERRRPDRGDRGRRPCRRRAGARGGARRPSSWSVWSSRSAGVVVLSYEEDVEHERVARRSIVLALLSALGFGALLHPARRRGDGPARAGRWSPPGSAASLAVAAAVARRPARPPRDPGLARRPRVAIGFFDIVGQHPLRGRLHDGPAAGGRGRRLDVPGVHDRARPHRPRRAAAAAAAGRASRSR